jgi:hypothetical protein
MKEVDPYSKEAEEAERRKKEDRRKESRRDKDDGGTTLDTLVGRYAKNEAWRVRIAFWARVAGWGGAGLAGVFSAVSYFWPHDNDALSVEKAEPSEKTYQQPLNQGQSFQQQQQQQSQEPIGKGY